MDSKLAKALSHSLRIEILQVLEQEMASPTKLSKLLGGGLSKVSYHVGVLRDSELIYEVKTVPHRGALEHFYRAIPRLDAHRVRRRDLPKAVQSTLTGSTVQAVIDESAAAIERETLGARDASQLSCIKTEIDAQAHEEISAAFDVALDTVRTALESSAIRLAAGGEGFLATIILASFESALKRGKQTLTGQRSSN